MIEGRAKARAALRVVGGPAGGEPIAPATRPAPDGELALVGILACREGGTALGIVREVLDWDGRQIRLRLMVDRQDRAGPTEAIVTLPLAAAAQPGERRRAGPAT